VLLMCTGGVVGSACRGVRGGVRIKSCATYQKSVEVGRGCQARARGTYSHGQPHNDNAHGGRRTWSRACGCVAAVLGRYLTPGPFHSVATGWASRPPLVRAAGAGTGGRVPCSTVRGFFSRLGLWHCWGMERTAWSGGFRAACGGDPTIFGTLGIRRVAWRETPVTERGSIDICEASGCKRKRVGEWRMALGEQAAQ
jgi:hypothetical protein